MHIAAIVQTRTGSTRLPGKVMYPLFGKSVLGHVISRLQRSRLLDDILVATTRLAQDDCIVEEANRYLAGVYRGSEDDVLDRFHEAALVAGCDWIVRITSDCPLVDATIVDAMLAQLCKEADDIDYLSNTLHRTFPRGLDVEVFSLRVLLDASAKARLKSEREHVTPYIHGNPGQYRLRSFTTPTDYSAWRWTLDTHEDWILIQEIYARLYPAKPDFHWRDVIQLFQEEPWLASINRGVVQKQE